MEMSLAFDLINVINIMEMSLAFDLVHRVMC